MILLLVVASLYLVYFLYLVLAGAGLSRTLGVLGVAARQSSITALVIGIVVGIFSVTGGMQAFSVVMLFMSLLALPNASLARAAEFILPSSSALEVVCFNVLAIAIGGPAQTFPIFDVFFQGGFHLLLNPLAFLMPPALGVALSLWPSVLALRLAAQGSRASPGLRRFLNVWVQLLSVIWVLSAAINSLLAFKPATPMSYVEALFASLGLIYVVLTWMTLTAEDKSSSNSIGRKDVVRALAERMDPGRLHPAALAVAGVITYLVTWTAMIYLLDGHAAASIGFVAVVVAGALLGRGEKSSGVDEATPPRTVSAWAFSAAALLVVLSLIRPLSQQMLAARAQSVYSLDNATVRRVTDLRAVDHSQRLCGYRWDGMHVLDCPVSYRRFSWSAVRHPSNQADPVAFKLEEASDYALSFGQRRVFCAQMTAEVRGPDGSVRPEVMLLVYVPGAPDGSQYAWLYEPKAACARVVEVVRPAASHIGPGFGYLWDAETASARKEKMAWLGELEDTSPPRAR